MRKDDEPVTNCHRLEGAEMERLTNIGTTGEIYITDNDETRKIGRKETAYAKLKELQNN